MIVVVEGLPGSGKTAICNDVVLMMSNGHLVPEIMAKYIKDTNYNQGWKTEKFYMQNDESKCSLARARSFSGFDVVMDRNYVATLAYNYAVTKTKIANTFTGVWQWFSQGRKLVRPDKYIYIYI